MRYLLGSGCQNNMNATNSAILSVINTISNGTLGVVVEMTTEPTWASVKSPYRGRVIKHTRITNASLGLSYENCVMSHAKADGVDVASEPYIPNAPKGMHYVGDNRRYLVSNTNEEQFYLNILYRGNENVSQKYYLDGVLVEDAEVLADIQSYIRQSKPCGKQIAYGVSEGNTIKVNRPKFENVALIQQGERVYRREPKPYSEVA